MVLDELARSDTWDKDVKMALAPPEPTGTSSSPFFKSIRLGLTGSYYKMTQALGLRRIQELLVRVYPCVP